MNSYESAFNNLISFSKKITKLKKFKKTPQIIFKNEVTFNRKKSSCLPNVKHQLTF